MSPCDTHDEHRHTHSPDCGHASVEHGDHVDYFHDGHVHRAHDDQWDECAPSHAADRGGSHSDEVLPRKSPGIRLRLD